MLYRLIPAIIYIVAHAWFVRKVYLQSLALREERFTRMESAGINDLGTEGKMGEIEKRIASNQFWLSFATVPGSVISGIALFIIYLSIVDIAS